MAPDPDDGVIRAADRFVEAVDAAVLIVTATDGVERSGCLVGFATQVSIDPWRFMVCVSKDNHTFAVAARANKLTVHLVADLDRQLASLFGEWSMDRIDKFAHADWHLEGDDTVILSGLPAFVGTVIERVDLGDHVGHVLEAVATHGPDPTRRTTLRLSAVADFVPGHPRG